ncbi:MAG: NAD(P)-binding domain-containing protein [Candidatus Micrarchaeota archaeon]|nr:NAD(P)-binding domain-containing protein [Candidatus Micrarchaeota archaeon]
MPTNQKVGIIGAGDMGSKMAEVLRKNDYSVVVYNRTEQKLVQFKDREGFETSTSLADFAKRLRASSLQITVLTMVLPDAETAGMVQQLSSMLSKGDTLIEGSNSTEDYSKANAALLKPKGINYLKMAYGGGPNEVLKAGTPNGAAVYVSGDKLVFERVEGIFKALSGAIEIPGKARTEYRYGYVGKLGAAEAAKAIHNIAAYAKWVIDAEAAELVFATQNHQPQAEIDTGEVLRLLSQSPPITSGFMESILRAHNDGKLSADADATTPKLSNQVKFGVEQAQKMGVSLTGTKAVLDNYPELSPRTSQIYKAAKKLLTGH